MHRGIAAAPAAPAALRTENLDCPRQAIGCVPMVERRSVRLVGDLRTDHQTTLCHRVLLSIRSMISSFACPLQQDTNFRAGSLRRIWPVRISNSASAHVVATVGGGPANGLALSRGSYIRPITRRMMTITSSRPKPPLG